MGYVLCDATHKSVEVARMNKSHHHLQHDTSTSRHGECVFAQFISKKFMWN